MTSKSEKKPRKQYGGITDKKDSNAGSSAFNQGSEQDPDYTDGQPVSDEEKKTGHTPSPANKQKTKSGN